MGKTYTTYESNVIARMAEYGVRPSAKHADDPLKEGRPVILNGKMLSADVRQSRGDPDWFFITARVTTMPNAARPLSGRVVFFLPPTFRNPVQQVKARREMAEFEFAATGSFTLACVLEEEDIILKLDLSSVPGAPAGFIDD